MSDTKTAPATRSVEAEITIDAPVEVVWKALTEADELTRWFPLEARVEPGEGGTVWMSWKNEYQGEAKIHTWEPLYHLRTTWGEHDHTGQIQLTDYHLEGRGGRTVLRVVTSGFPPDPTWDAWVEGTSQGWRYELASLKHYLERYRGRDREVVYLRRRTPTAGGEAWARIMGPDGLGPRPLGGTPFIEEPPLQYAAIVHDPEGGLLRISTDPCFGRDDVRDVTLWLAAYGADGRRMEDLRREWSGLLGRLYPEGESV